MIKTDNKFADNVQNLLLLVCLPETFARKNILHHKKCPKNVQNKNVQKMSKNKNVQKNILYNFRKTIIIIFRGV